MTLRLSGCMLIWLHIFQAAQAEIGFRRLQVGVEANVGSKTAPETFRFTKNRWFAEDRPDRSRVKLPTAEKDGTYGVDPRDAS